jgi:hypothetical protein
MNKLMKVDGTSYAIAKLAPIGATDIGYPFHTYVIHRTGTSFNPANTHIVTSINDTFIRYLPWYYLIFK